MKKWTTLFLLFSVLFIMAQKVWTLEEAVNYAIQNNLQVLNSDYNTQIQENNLKVAKKEFLPSVSANINNNLSFGQSLDVFGNARRNDNFNNNTNVGANFLLYNQGRLDKNIRRNEFALEANRYDVLQIKNDISLQVAQQYLQVLLNKEIKTISNSALENAEKLYKRAKITTEVGTTPKTILAEAEATLAREKQNVKTAEINVSRSLFDLAQILQLKDYQNFDIEPVYIEDQLSAPLHDAQNILEIAYSNQPQLLAAEYRIKSAEAQTEVAKTAFWPTITATAGLGTSFFNSLVTNVGGVDIFGNPISENGFFKQYNTNFGQQIGITANIPIFNKGITKLQVEQAKINEDVAKNNLAQQRQIILQNVQRAEFDAESAYQNYIAAVEVEKSTKLALDFAEKSYAAGISTIYDVNIARNNYANARGSVSQAKYNYLFSLKLLNFYAGIPLTL